MGVLGIKNNLQEVLLLDPERTETERNRAQIFSWGQGKGDGLMVRRASLENFRGGEEAKRQEGGIN